MAKIDKQMQSRMDGCLYAIHQIENYNKEGKDGLAEFKQEMIRRGFYRLDISITEKEYLELYQSTNNCIYNNMITMMMWALKESEGFGKSRLKRVKAAYDKALLDCMELNYLMNHYVTVSDYAVELNRQYDLGLDAEFLAASQEVFDEAQKKKQHFDWLKGIINTLRMWGYEEPAQRFEEKMK